MNGLNAVLERRGYGMLPRNTRGPLGPSTPCEAGVSVRYPCTQRRQTPRRGSPLGNRRSTFVNATLDPEKRITGFYAGDVAQAHDAGWTAAEAETAIRVNRRCPVVLATNSEYTLDQNVHQTVK